VADQSDVNLVGLLRVVGNEAKHLVVGFVEGRLRPEQPEPRSHSVHMRVHRHVRAAEGEEQDACGRLSPDARQGLEELERPLARRFAQPAEVEVAGFAFDHFEDLLDPL